MCHKKCRSLRDKSNTEGTSELVGPPVLPHSVASALSDPPVTFDLLQLPEEGRVRSEHDAGVLMFRSWKVDHGGCAMDSRVLGVLGCDTCGTVVFQLRRCGEGVDHGGPVEEELRRPPTVANSRRVRLQSNYCCRCGCQ